MKVKTRRENWTHEYHMVPYAILDAAGDAERFKSGFQAPLSSLCPPLESLTNNELGSNFTTFIVSFAR